MSAISLQMCDESKNILEGNDHDVVLIIKRTKNENCVVYKANMNAERTAINEKQPLSIFWLKLTPEQIQS